MLSSESSHAQTNYDITKTIPPLKELSPMFTLAQVSYYYNNSIYSNNIYYYLLIIFISQLNQ